MKVRPSRPTRLSTRTDSCPGGSPCYRYPGSLTTPPGSETVEWLLLTDPVQVADADIAGFAKLYAMNARPAQKANRRAVLRSG
jgi:carbonic anhydrase